MTLRKVFSMYFHSFYFVWQIEVIGRMNTLSSLYSFSLVPKRRDRTLEADDLGSDSKSTPY